MAQYFCFCFCVCVNFTKPGSKTGFHGKWQFKIETSPSVDFIKDKVNISPVAIAFEVDANFSALKQVSKTKIKRRSYLSAMYLIK